MPCEARITTPRLRRSSSRSSSSSTKSSMDVILRLPSSSRSKLNKKSISGSSRSVSTLVIFFSSSSMSDSSPSSAATIGVGEGDAAASSLPSPPAPSPPVFAIEALAASRRACSCSRDWMMVHLSEELRTRWGFIRSSMRSGPSIVRAENLGGGRDVGSGKRYSGMVSIRIMWFVSRTSWASHSTPKSAGCLSSAFSSSGVMGFSGAGRLTKRSWYLY
mmetsp:Transcript_20745/g.39449  ORF Transcript_20745/g.39449 Transcript_20745/m.39449 type:complete len:218 (-) Transcript_20745:648-1301(-)